jgi:hypothetical protein
MKEYNESTYRSIVTYSTEYMGELLSQFRCKSCGDLDIEAVTQYHSYSMRVVVNTLQSAHSNFICESCEKSRLRDLKIENILNDVR